MKLDESVSTVQTTVCTPFGHIQSVLTWKVLGICHLRVLQFLQVSLFLAYVYIDCLSFSWKVRMQLADFSLVKYNCKVLFPWVDNCFSVFEFSVSGVCSYTFMDILFRILWTLGRGKLTHFVEGTHVWRPWVWAHILWRVWLPLLAPELRFPSSLFHKFWKLMWRKQRQLRRRKRENRR